MGIHTKNLLRSSPSLVSLILIVALSAQMGVSGKPAADTIQDGAQKIVDTAESTWDKIKDFWHRMILTFTGEADDLHPGLSATEIAIVIVVAVCLFFMIFCCIGYFLCACVKELICCICCCSCCRD